MPLTTGARLGDYEVLDRLGAGGMGEVFRARDTKLNRVAALKVLPDIFLLDADRLARFKREAQVLASLNHSNIGAIYGFVEVEGVQALALELVEGPTLDDRLRHAALPVDEAVAIARQIADALEAAHEQGVVHRDLKPANIKVREDGTVKVLDFGLAKVLEAGTSASGASAAPALTMSPTITTPAMTQMGVILGTAPYMSPEQAKGRPADKRSDLWAFGSVLYEMLTGKRAFAGEDVSDTLAAVLRAEPDWTALPADTPHATRFLLRRCLEKDRRNRVADASTIRFVLAAPTLSMAGAGSPIAETRPSFWRRAAPVAAAAVAASAATGTVIWTLASSAPSTRGVTRFPVALQETQSFGSNGLRLVAVSPDGSHITYAALSLGEPGRATQRLYIRPMFETAAKPISGTEVLGNVVGAPVFSPDNQSIVYYAGASTGGTGLYTGAKGALKRISANGGSAVTLCDGGLPLGMSWSGDAIVLGQLSGGIVRVRASGGEPEQIVSIKEGEIAQGPQLLPDGDAVLFTHVRGVSTDPTDETWDKADIVVQSLKSGARKTLVQGGSDARYLPSGHLVYAVSGTLRAVPFDAKRLEIVGKPTPILEGVGRSRFGPTIRTGSAHASVSDTGSLVYIPGPVSPASSLQNLAYIERGGAVESLKLPPGRYEFPHVSPDGKNVAVGITDGSEANLWVYDLSRTTTIRQLTTGGKNRFPVWSADGQYIAFQSDRDGDSRDLLAARRRKRAAGAVDEARFRHRARPRRMVSEKRPSLVRCGIRVRDFAGDAVSARSKGRGLSRRSVGNHSAGRRLLAGWPVDRVPSQRSAQPSHLHPAVSSDRDRISCCERPPCSLLGRWQAALLHGRRSNVGGRAQHAAEVQRRQSRRRQPEHVVGGSPGDADGISIRAADFG